MIKYFKVLVYIFTVLHSSAVLSSSYNIKEIETKLGLKFWFIQDDTVPLVSLNFSFRNSGFSADPSGKEGLGRMVSFMLDEGAGKYNSVDYKNRLEKIAARISFSTNRDHFHGNLWTLSTKWEEALNMLRLSVTLPRFDSSAVDRIRAKMLLSLRRKSESPNWISRKTWLQTVFPNHPYSNIGDGSEESLTGISIDDLKSYVKNRFVRENLKIAAVGNISEERLRNDIDLIFGELSLQGKTVKISYTDPPQIGKTIILRRPISQSIVMLGHRGIRRDNPDWYAAMLLTHIFGGGLSSRLSWEVREKRGLAYSIYAYLNPMQHSTVLASKVATKNSRVSDSIQLIRDEWKKISRNGISEQELRDAKAYLNGSFPLLFRSGQTIANLLLQTQLLNLTIADVENRALLINSVSLKHANRVAEQLYNEEALTVVVVGNPK
tara:strand:- start:378 stop:1685 length:1308 start_codon:yes stop_codon:yes gene_type:complete